jgi:hypothetical protein
MAAYKMAAVKVTPPNDFPPRPNKVTYGCYQSIPNALRFTKGGKGLTHHPVLTSWLYSHIEASVHDHEIFKIDVQYLLVYII